MHEMSIATAILEKVLEIADQHGGLPVERISLQIGAQRQVVPEFLETAFQAAAADTLAEKAVLDWRQIEAQVECQLCRQRFQPEGIFWECTACGAPGGKMIQGDELTLESIDLKDPEDG